VADSPRIEELRRRIQQDPASLAFAPLAEEYRRAGRLDEAIRTCRTGLKRHPDYATARATLGRALLEQGMVDAAFVELAAVLEVAPEHLGALRGLGEIHSRRGEIDEAIETYRTALSLVRHDDDLVRALAALEASRPAAPTPVADLARTHEALPGDARHRLELFLDRILADRARRLPHA
jgi:tetratricopeptide (TPR) repeat protein